MKIHMHSDQINNECEKVSLANSDNNNSNKKFKIININQAMTNKASDVDGNNFGHKTQLIEIDKLIINNGPLVTPTSLNQQHRKSSKIGVWHQVSKLSLHSQKPLLKAQKRKEENLFFSTSNCCKTFFFSFRT